MKSIFITLTSICLFNMSLAQKDEVLLEIDSKKVTKSEFLQIYLKNNPNPKYDKNSLDEYMELFKKFKLKVAEAEALGYDTIPKLQKELEGYRKSLALPYLVDNEKNEEMVKQAYERLKKEIKASHILIRVDENASSADTLKAYNRILILKNRIENGENFNDVAKGKGGSEDPSVTQNGGDLGYFTAFQMVFPFEEAAFTTPIGKISNPIRTKFGYHILKVEGERPARGTMTAAHIMVATSKSDTPEQLADAEKKAKEIYDKLKSGSKFEELVEAYSDDFNTNEKGGLLPPFGSGTSTRMLPEFEEAAFALKNDGDISEPVKSPYGIHIIKRVSWKDIASFDSMKKELQNKVKRDDRAKKTQEYYVEKLKKEYHYSNKSEKNLKVFYNSIDSNYFKGSWKSDVIKTNKTLFTLNNKEFNTINFAKYLEKNYSSAPKINTTDLVNLQYKKWEKAEILAYEETQLERKYPEYKALMQEYHDGILLYEVMSDQVWNKAGKDSTGLKEYYKNNFNKYQWKKRLNAEIYECLNQEIANEVYKMLKNDTINSKHVLEKINAKSELNLRVRTNKFEQSETTSLKNQTLNLGLNQPYKVDDKYYVVKVKEILPEGPKSFEEAKGAITADYQNFLEKNWLDGLAKKHPVKIYENVLYSLGQNK